MSHHENSGKAMRGDAVSTGGLGALRATCSANAPTPLGLGRLLR